MADHEILDENDAPPRTNRLVIVAVVLIVIVAIGALTALLGIGPFGYRIFRYGSAKVFLYNGTPHFAEVDLDGTDYELLPYSGKTVEVIGGSLDVDTTLRLVKVDPETKKPEETDERRHLESDSFQVDGKNWLYHIAESDSSCVAVTDVSAYYDSDAGGDADLLMSVFNDARLRELDVEEVIFPQDTLPDKATPPLIYLGVVNCEVLADEHLGVEKALVKVRLDIEASRRALEKKRELIKQMEDMKADVPE